MTYPDGEGPVTRDEAKDRLAAALRVAKHKPKRNDPRDEKTRDDRLDDPAKNKEDE